MEKKAQKDEFYRMAATKQQEDEGLTFLSDEGMIMDRSNREVQAILDALENMIVVTKERLKPFLDEGFIHTDR